MNSRSGFHSTLSSQRWGKRRSSRLLIAALKRAVLNSDAKHFLKTFSEVTILLLQQHQLRIVTGVLPKGRCNSLWKLSFSSLDAIMQNITVSHALSLGLSHHQAGRLTEAEAIYRQILALQPRHAEALHFLGVIASQVGRYDLALEWIRQATIIAPDYAVAHNNLGSALQKLGQFDEAVSAYKRAIQLQPGFAEAYCNLGESYRDCGRLDEATEALRRALYLRPDLVDAHLHLAATAVLQGHLIEAEAAYRYALRLQPNQPAVQSSLICTLLLQPGADDRIRIEKESWNKRFSRRLETLPVHANTSGLERRLRLGYVSPDFRNHVISWYLTPLFEHHDRSRFEIVCYSGVVRPDAVTEEFQKEANQWRNIANVGDDALVEMILNDGIDILVDLTQHTLRNRLTAFARKPAPIQVSFAGYPEGTGLEAIEYRISDRWLEQHAKSSDSSAISKGNFSEQLFLIDSFWCYDFSGCNTSANRISVANANDKITFGSLNYFGKINEPLLILWARVLKSVKDSRLIILGHEGSHRQRTWQFLKDEGVASHRVEFVTPRPRKEYLELYHQIDIVLDTFPYNGHTTSLDALWMGVPVVSLCGERPVSRAGLSQLSNLGLPELVAFNEDQYVEIATKLANNIPRLQELRATLRQRMEKSVLMDGAHFARQIEACYRSMWRQWCESHKS